MSDSEVDQLEDEVFVWPKQNLLEQEIDAIRHDRDQKQMENDLLVAERKKLVEAVASGEEKNVMLLTTIKILNRRLDNCRELKNKLEEEFEQLWDRLQ